MSKKNEVYYYAGNSFADTLKAIAIVLGLIFIIAGIFIFGQSEIFGILSIISGLVIGILLYSDAEKIDLLNDIKENTEHLRDNIYK